MAQSPELRASFERWQASVHRVSRARRLPKPTLGFGYFVRSVETRVGPQRARLSLQQAFPWPAKLSAGADAASARARALQRRFDAHALSIAQRVTHAYWSLWQIRTVRSLRRAHLSVLRSLSESVRGRVATSASTLADLQQVDLAAARLDDRLSAMDEAERAAQAQLRAAIGLRGMALLPTPGEPPEAQPLNTPREVLAGQVKRHPRLVSFALMAQAEEANARAQAAEHLPDFAVGADWIITGEAAMPNLADSGKDAVIIRAGVAVPLWQGSYTDAVHAARAEARAQRAEQRAATNQALAELDSSLAAVRNAARRIKLHRKTLVPQAEAAYESVLGAYVTGRGSLAQALLAQRELLDLRVGLERARANYAQSWARLTQIVGHEFEQPATAPHLARRPQQP